MQAAAIAIQRLPNDADLVAVERIVAEAIKRECRAFNRKNPEIIVIANEAEPSVAAQVKATSIALQQPGNLNAALGRGRKQTSVSSQCSYALLIDPM